MSLGPQAAPLWHQSPLLWPLQTLPTQGLLSISALLFHTLLLSPHLQSSRVVVGCVSQHLTRKTESSSGTEGI